MSTSNENRMSAEQKQKIIKHITEKAPGMRCAACGSQDFFVGDDLVTPVPLTSTGNMVLGGSSVPVALLVCRNCAHVMHFAAVPMGVVSAGDTEGKDDGAR